MRHRLTAIPGHARIVLPRGVVHLPCTADHESWLVLCSAQRLRLAKIIGLIPLYDYIAQDIGYSESCCSFEMRHHLLGLTNPTLIYTNTPASN